jgi:16S rRNA processing protein RimM
MGEKRLKVARVLGPHGIKGAVKLQVFLENVEMLGTLTDIADEAGKPMRLSLQGVSGKALVARIAGIESREAAEALGKPFLFAPRHALPAPEPDEFYAADLVGLAAFEGERRLGQVVEVRDFGATPLLEIKPDEGPTVLVPFTAEAVPEIDMAAGRIMLVLQPGLWPED